MLKRILLFVVTNILIVTTISVLLNVLGVRPYLSASGIDYQALLVFCLIWGFTGAFISLALSRVMAKWMVGIKVIQPNDPQYGWLHGMIEVLARGVS